MRSGGVAGFAMPTLRYFVTRGGSSEAVERGGAEEFTQLAPTDKAVVGSGELAVFQWGKDPRAAWYRLEVVDSANAAILSALVPAGRLDYRSPPWLAEKATWGSARWRVVALDPAGEPIRRTAWRALRFVPPNKEAP